MYWSVLITDNDNIYSSKIRLGCKKNNNNKIQTKKTHLDFFLTDLVAYLKKYKCLWIKQH